MSFKVLMNPLAEDEPVTELTREKVEAVLKPSLFRDWLRDQPRSSIVGITRKSMCCPLATYLRSALPGTSAMIVGTTVVSKLGKDGEYIQVYFDTPKWAIRFVRCVDDWGKGMNIDVSAREALRLLGKSQ